MQVQPALESRLAEVLMGALFPCDLGDGIEVIHEVEVIEIEMDCDLGDQAWESAPYERIEIRFESATAEDVSDTIPFSLFEVIDTVIQETVPYPRPW